MSNNLEPLKSDGNGGYTWKASQAEKWGYTRRALEDLTKGMDNLNTEIGKSREEITKLKEKAAFWGATAGGIAGFVGGFFRGQF